MTHVNILQKVERFLSFSVFYAALVLIFYVSILTTSHLFITLPFLSIYHTFTTEHGLFYSLYLAAINELSTYRLWDIFLNVTSGIAAIAAATYSIRQLFDSH